MLNLGFAGFFVVGVRGFLKIFYFRPALTRIGRVTFLARPRKVTKRMTPHDLFCFSTFVAKQNSLVPRKNQRSL